MNKRNTRGQKNIFSPSFGNRPAELVGRDSIITSFMDGIDSPPGGRERATVIIGQRGMGKTVLLLELAEIAKREGYIVASPTISSDDMLERVIEKMQSEGEKAFGDKKTKLTGGSIGFLGFSVGLQFTVDEERKSFTYKLSKLVEAINAKGSGVLILIDEMQSNSPGMKQLIIAYQELVGMGADVAIAFAGLPGAISNILNDKVLTFLNRANKIELGFLNKGDIDSYYMHAFDELGIRLNHSQRSRAVDATGGSPYMMQLIGYYLTKYADDGMISDEILYRAIEVAEEQFIGDVCRTTLNTLSDVDIDFLNAMLTDDESSNIADISAKMDVSREYAQRYKKRLIDAGVIMQERRGEVGFAVPFLKDYLKRIKG